MRECISALLNKYGEALTVTSDLAPNGRQGFALIEPLDLSSRASEHKPSRAGLAQPRRYMLIASAGLFADGEKNREISLGGHTYTVMRAEAIYLAGETTHWECILRRKDVPEHD